MPNKSERLQEVWHLYEQQQGHAPSGTRAAVEWGVRQGLIDLPETDPYDVLAGQMAGALRDEMGTDAEGRRFRVNHAVRITKNGVQQTMWAIMGYAPHTHMEKAFAQRREQIIGDCVQLKTDVDAYNGMTVGSHAPIQIVLDFTDDVAERQHGKAA